MKAGAITSSRVRSWLPRRPLDSHKGLNGHVLIVAGSRGMSGAAILTALGALQTGAGLVTVATIPSERPTVAARVPEALTLALPETRAGCIGPGAYPVLRRYWQGRRINVIAAGPGLSVHPSVRNLILALLEKWTGSLVLDADGLNNIKPIDIRRRQGLVLTPHVGELARLSRVNPSVVRREGLGLAEALAKRLSCTCVLKGHRTLVTDGTRTYCNTTGNPAMATGGMGDVLTGIVASFLGQGLSALQAAAAGVYLHGLAGDLARESDRGLLATHLARVLPLALKKIGVK
ncbi:MAG: NAD(P)H-hydrate dehydratase [Elusimicrobiota bacterium]|jgi:NAD(P)H-hydrate epimerase